MRPELGGSCSGKGVHYGLGKHVLAVEKGDRSPPSDIVNAFKVSNRGESYGSGVGLELFCR